MFYKWFMSKASQAAHAHSERHCRMSTFEAVREVTGWQRPTQKHGCTPCEVFPGIYTAHFHEMDSRAKLFDAIQEDPAGGGPPVLVVNSAPCQCDAKGDFFGAGVTVWPVDLEDDPDEKKQFDQGKSVTSKCANKDIELKMRCAGDAKKHFDEVSDQIEKTLGAGGKVMVHCHASISRSVAFIVAYIVRTHGRTAVDVMEEMKQQWDATWPCDRFVMQLIEYENELKARNERDAAFVHNVAVGMGVGLVVSMVIGYIRR